MIPKIQSSRREKEVHYDLREKRLLERPDIQTPEDILLDMGVLVDRVEDVGNQEVFIGPHVNKDGNHEFQDVG